MLSHFYLSGALASDSANFTNASPLMPESFELLREHVAMLQSDRPLIFLLFHMAGMPLVSMLANQAGIACGVKHRQVRRGQRNRTQTGMIWRVAARREALSA